MAEIEIPDEVLARLKAVVPLMETVMEDAVPIEEATAIAITRGLDAIVADVLGTADRETLLLSLQQLAAHAPGTVYSFMAAIMAAGGEDSRDRLRERFQTGFRAEAG